MEPLFPLPVPVVFPYKWTKMITLGADYTFGVGNGLVVRVEHMATALSEKALGWDEDAHASAFSLSYTIGIMDTLMAVGYYSWEQKKMAQYVRWQRTYDNLDLSLGLFYYPETGERGALFNQSRDPRSYGAQLMIIFNH